MAVLRFDSAMASPEPRATPRPGPASEIAAPSVLSSWTRIIVDALVAMNADVQAVLDVAGLSHDSFGDPNGRLPSMASGRLWRAAAEHMQDPAFGLRASKYVTQTTFHALGYAIFASDSLRDALERLVRYGAVVSDAAELRLETTDDTVRLSFLFPESAAHCPEAMDAVMSLIVRTARALTTREFALLRVEQHRPEPLDLIPYERFFRCPVAFGCQVDALVIDAATLDRRLPTANAELASHNDDLARRYLAGLSEGSIVHRVRGCIIERLTSDPSSSRVAEALGMSPRSLQRRLQEHGTSYAAMLADTRRELACRYLREPAYSVTEVTFLLGFEDASAFARAFRRWTGESPSEYRARLASAP